TGHLSSFQIDFGETRLHSFRGKREARRPWFMQSAPSGLKGRNLCVITPIQGCFEFDSCTRGDALRACP
ncbi:MAG TPA: hypothetical protein VKA97_08450, partial [Pyrinomonadaceae bacterium]|nr:hypothetical protein [Pyrinomonadaceae bacterium]